MSHATEFAQGHETRRVEHGESNEAITHVPPGEGRRALWVLGELLTLKVPSQQTGGAYALFEVITQPGGGTLPHVQHREDELFYVLGGEFEFSIGKEALRVGAGSLLYIPKGTLHAHKNFGEEVGRMLMSQTPGGLYERFFEKVGDEVRNPTVPPAMEGTPHEAKLAAIAAEYGIEVTHRRGQVRPACVPEH